MRAAWLTWRAERTVRRGGSIQPNVPCWPSNTSPPSLSHFYVGQCFDVATSIEAGRPPGLESWCQTGDCGTPFGNGRAHPNARLGSQQSLERLLDRPKVGFVRTEAVDSRGESARSPRTASGLRSATVSVSSKALGASYAAQRVSVVKDGCASDVPSARHAPLSEPHRHATQRTLPLPNPARAHSFVVTKELKGRTYSDRSKMGDGREAVSASEWRARASKRRAGARVRSSAGSAAALELGRRTLGQ